MYKSYMNINNHGKDSSRNQVGYGKQSNYHNKYKSNNDDQNSNQTNQMNQTNQTNQINQADDAKREKYLNMKRRLIKYIYSTIDISQFKYEVLEYDQQLNKFISGTYYMSPNYSGKNCFLIFTQINSTYYSSLVNRHKLSYTFNKVDIDNVEVFNCNVDVELSIYNGTIFDGIYIRKGNEHKYIITDVYYFRGTDYTKVKLKHKMLETKCYLDNLSSQMKMNNNINNRFNLELQINELNDVTDLRNYMKNNIAKYQDNHIRGLCFYPNISGTKLIYNFGNEDKLPSTYSQLNQSNQDNQISQQNQPSQSSQSNQSIQLTHSSVPREGYENDNSGDNKMKRSKRLTKRVYVAQTDEPVHAVLEMKATTTVDNYKLYAVEKIKSNDSVRLKKCQMDIAYIADIKKSQWCRHIINNSPKGSVFVKCVWRDDKRKWEPFELNEEVKLPSLMDDIRKNLIEMEESGSESDEN